MRQGIRSEGNQPGAVAHGHIAGCRPQRGSLRSTPRRGSRDRQPPRLRLFVALDLPATVRLGVDAWGREALADPALRRTTAPNLRVTLAFLGPRPETEVPRLRATIRRACEGAPAPLIELRAPEAKPDRGRPRLVLLPAHSPETEILYINLRTALVDRGLYEPTERRPYKPHLTVARVRPEGHGSRRPRLIQQPPSGPLPPSLLAPFRGVSVGLYRSELHPDGVRHDLLERVDLAAQAG